VRALTRDPRSAKSQALAAAGAQLVAGNLEDPQSLDAALSGAYGIYNVQTFMGPDGIAGEERQGRAIAEAAARVKVEHFVYGSVGGAERNTSIPHFESKHRIETYIAELGLPATVLRPALFMNNFALMGPARAGDQLVLTLALNPGAKLQMIDSENIGLFAADAFATRSTTSAASWRSHPTSSPARKWPKCSSASRASPPASTNRTSNSCGSLAPRWLSCTSGSTKGATAPTFRRCGPSTLS
jgi:uncharacterized protein YbjT (DUF2867 family)